MLTCVQGKMQLELKLSSEKSAHDIEQCQPRYGLSSSVSPPPTWRWYTMSPMRTSGEECQNCTQQNLQVNINATMLQQHRQIRRHICHVSLALRLEDDDAAADGSCPAKNDSMNDVLKFMVSLHAHNSMFLPSLNAALPLQRP